MSGSTCQRLTIAHGGMLCARSTARPHAVQVHILNHSLHYLTNDQRARLIDTERSMSVSTIGTFGQPAAGVIMGTCVLSDTLGDDYTAVLSVRVISCS